MPDDKGKPQDTPGEGEHPLGGPPGQTGEHPQGQPPGQADKPQPKEGAEDAPDPAEDEKSS